jgi:hypothetical protein
MPGHYRTTGSSGKAAFRGDQIVNALSKALSDLISLLFSLCEHRTSSFPLGLAPVDFLFELRATRG